MSAEAEKYIEKYTTKDQDDWLVQKKDIVAKFMQSYAEAYHKAELEKIAERAKNRLVDNDTKTAYWHYYKLTKGLKQ